MPSRKWSDPQYLRHVQYKDADKLLARANLHRRYGTSAEPWFSWLAAQVQWPDAGEVLDIGCGPGWLWVSAAGDLPASLTLTLADLSAPMSTMAFARVSATGAFASVESLEADIQSLPFESHSFDVVVANHIIYHAPSPSLAVQEIARVLRPDGTLLAATNGPSNLRELREIAVGVFGGSTEETATTPFDARTGWAILESRFARVEWREYKDSLECTSVDDMVAYVMSSTAGETATEIQVGVLRRVLQERLDEGDGVFLVSKETGAFVARSPLRDGVVSTAS